MMSELSPLLLNRAQCALRSGSPAAAEADCSRVLDTDGGNAKALYRRACAREALGALPGALADAARLLSVESRSAPAAELLRRLRIAAAATPCSLIVLVRASERGKTFLCS